MKSTNTCIRDLLASRAPLTDNRIVPLLQPYGL